MKQASVLSAVYKSLLREQEEGDIFASAEIMTPGEFIEKYSEKESEPDAVNESVSLFDLLFEAVDQKRKPKPPQSVLTPDGDIKGRELEPEEIADTIRSRSAGEKLPGNIPYIHPADARDVAYRRSLPTYSLRGKDLKDRKVEEEILVVDEKNEPIDLTYLAKKLTDYSSPNFKILKQNEKMKKSTTGELEAFYNIGIPAIMGLVFDEKQGKFIIINTCPSAGSCMHACYATKGGYVQYQRASEKQNLTLNLLYNRPEEYMEKTVLELTKEVKKYAKKNIKTVIRWHDSGDFYSAGYLDVAIKIIEKTKQQLPEQMRGMIQFYAYTKRSELADQYKGKGLLLRKSIGATPAEERRINPTEDMFSQIVPKEVKDDLIKDGVIKKIKDKWVVLPGKERNLKNAILSSPKVRFKNTYPMLTMHEYETKEDTSWPEDEKVNVIILPGDNDRPAKDIRVAGVYLMFH